MRNKKSVMAFAALLILYYHLWLYDRFVKLSDLQIFLRNVTFVGVDMFFLVSAYSIGRREITDLKKFYVSRITSVYLKFVLFALVAFLDSALIKVARYNGYAKWNIKQFLRVISGVELFKKGGGAVLWFLPAIMIFYILAPIIQRAAKKNWYITLIAMLAIWFVVGLIFKDNSTFKNILIFWNRLPVLIAGFYMGRTKAIDKFLSDWKKTLIVSIPLILVGLQLAWKFANQAKLNKPFGDFFYVTALPLAIGIAMLISLVPEVLPIKLMGESTLEMYAIQMLWGYWLTNELFMKTKSYTKTNVLMLLIIIASSIVVAQAYKYARKGINKGINKLISAKSCK